MTDAAPEAPAQEPTAEAKSAEQPKADETDWKAEARKWEALAKKNNAKAEQAAEKARLDAMSESERAIAEAEAKGRTAGLSEASKELAQTKFESLAGRRNPEFDTTKALKRLDLASLLGEDGRPDLKEIQAAVDDLVPEPAGGMPSFDGGIRTPAPAQQGMSGLIRKAAGRA